MAAHAIEESILDRTMAAVEDLVLSEWSGIWLYSFVLCLIIVIEVFFEAACGPGAMWQTIQQVFP